MKLEKLAPAFQDYLWGGTKLRMCTASAAILTRWPKAGSFPPTRRGESALAGGERDGLPLGQYFSTVPQALGKNAAAFESFPVLIKLIDAKEPLSIQVHPSDEYALRVEGEYGKTEMWVIVDCDPGAFLYFGVNRPVSKEEFRQRIENNTVLEVLNKVEVHPGDVFFIQSGTIHAIGAGISSAKSSRTPTAPTGCTTTTAGAPTASPARCTSTRPWTCAPWSPQTPPATWGRCSPARGAPPKSWGSAPISPPEAAGGGGPHLRGREESFLSLVCVEGSGLLCGPENILEFTAGESLLVPAGTGKVSLRGDCTVIQTTVRGRRKDRHRQGGYTMKIILMGEPMGLFMANETGSLSEVNTFTASIAGAEYNVAVGLAAWATPRPTAPAWALTPWGSAF